MNYNFFMDKKVISTNRKAFHDFLIFDKFVAGIVLTGTEIKSIRKGTINLKSERVSIVDLAAECTDEMIYLANDKGIKIILHNYAENEYVWGDMVQLRRVVMNLLSNGIKYAYPNTELIVKVYNEQNTTCFLFEHKSPYLNPDKRKSIFARYISYSKTHNGIGLGLYASKKIVEAHGGEIFVQSYTNNITSFGFKIPNTKPPHGAERIVVF